jgi:single-strand DNA-binding protein
MADLNKVFLMGRLAFDPQLRRTPNGTAVAELRLATSRVWTGRDGERREESLFIDVTVWDRQAENCCQYLRKGSSIHVEGSLRMDTWEDKNSGEKRSKIRVHADPGGVQFLDTRRTDGGGDYSGPAPGDELAPAPQAARDTGYRRGGPGPGPGPGPAPVRGPGGGYGEPRGPANGPGRAPFPPSGPTSHPPLDEEREDDDIPF